MRCEEKGVVANRARGTIRGIKYTGKDWGILRNVSNFEHEINADYSPIGSVQTALVIKFGYSIVKPRNRNLVTGGDSGTKIPRPYLGFRYMKSPCPTKN